jgi:hypothetical protein
MQRSHYLAIDHKVYPEIIKIKERQIDRLREEIKQKHKAIQEILHSTSWKLTRPLRWLKEMWQP